MATDLYTLLPQVKPYVREASDAVCKQAIRWAMGDFARQTESLREDVTLTSVADQASYDLGQTTNTEIIRVAGLWQTSKQGTLIHQDSYTVTTAGNLVFDAAPTVDDLTYVAELALLPLDAIVGSYPSDHATKWGRAIVAGAVSYLKRQSDMPWGGVADVWVDDYKGMIARARLEVMSERRSADMTITPRRFF